jgi:lipopolysaccharide export system protein LptC
LRAILADFPGKAAIVGLKAGRGPKEVMSRANPVRRSGIALLLPGNESARHRVDAFRAAKRHSRRVRLLRWALPSAALGGLALIVLVVWLDPLRFYRNLPIEFGRISITDNKLTIEAPKLSGYTQDRRPYSVTAAAAAQDLGQPHIIELAGILGQVELVNRGETEIRAQRGVYNMKAGQLELTEGIEIGATGGYRIVLNDASIEVRKGHVITNNAVQATFPDGTLQANRMEIFEHGDRLRFDGGVVVRLRLPPPDENKGGAKTADVVK